MRCSQAVSLGCSPVRSPRPRLRAVSRATARIRCALPGGPCISGSDTRLKMIGHAMTAGNLVREDGGRALVLGALHFAHPYCDTVAHTARRGLKPAVRPIGCMERVMELRLPVETVEVGADELAVLHTHAHVVDQVGHAPGGVDLIVGTTRSARFRLEYFDVVRQALFQDEDARQPRIWGSVCDVDTSSRSSRSQFALLRGGGMLH